MPAMWWQWPASAQLLHSRGAGSADGWSLTKGDAQVARHDTEVDQLCRHPDGPQRLAVVPQLGPVLFIDGLWGAALHETLHAVEHWEVAEGVTGGRQAGRQQGRTRWAQGQSVSGVAAMGDSLHRGWLLCTQNVPVAVRPTVSCLTQHKLGLPDSPARCVAVAVLLLDSLDGLVDEGLDGGRALVP